jgi:hypothetical protein
MISYMDEQRNTIAPSPWIEADRRLVDAILAIGSEFGDQSHTSGPVDYLIRFLVNVPDTAVREKIPNYFLVLVTNDGVDTVTKIGDEEPSRGGHIMFQKEWEDGIRDRFRAFRQRLD